MTKLHHLVVFCCTAIITTSLYAVEPSQLEQAQLKVQQDKLELQAAKKEFYIERDKLKEIKASVKSARKKVIDITKRLEADAEALRRHQQELEEQKP